MARKRLGEILVEAGAIDDARLRAALNEQRRWGGTLGRILVDMNIVTEDALVDALSRQLGLPLVKLEGRQLDNKALDIVPIELCEQHLLIPLARDAKFLDVAMSDPTNLGIIDELRIRTRLNVRPFLAGPRSIEKAIQKWYYGRGSLTGNFDSGGTDLAVGAVGLSMLTTEESYARRGGLGAEAAAQLADPHLASLAAGLGTPQQRELEIQALQGRVQALEALVQRDEDVLRKLLALLIEKNVCTREEILERIR